MISGSCLAFWLSSFLADVPSSLQAQPSGSEAVYFYHLDHLGTPVKMTDSSGTVVWQWQYGPFGEEPLTMEPNLVNQSLRFPGQYYDAETGLNYNFFRYYHPILGRYLQPDIISIDKIIQSIPFFKNEFSRKHISGKLMAEINNSSFADLILMIEIVTQTDLSDIYFKTAFFPALFSAILQNPDNLHKFIYALNNPLLLSDLFALLNINDLMKDPSISKLYRCSLPDSKGCIECFRIKLSPWTTNQGIGGGVMVTFPTEKEKICPSCP
jgi:RHS repeat-associated protein